MAAPELSRVVVAGLRVPYLELGSRDGPPVVLVPGLSDGLAPITRRATRQLYAKVPLPLERMRGIVVSHRSPVSPRVTTRQLATDLAGVLEVVLTRPAILVCHSMGGMVAQHLAADRPDLVAALVLSASSARSDASVRAVLSRWDALVDAHRFEAFARDAVETSFTGPALRDRRRLLQAEPVPRPPAALVPRHLALSAACATHDASSRLQAISRPALVLAGRDDKVVPAAHSAELAEGLPNARFVMLPGLGHGFPEQDPQSYRDHVAPFLAEAVVG
jgi:pimeloyl-ACP methyl ester carboxylesterase